MTKLKKAIKYPIRVTVEMSKYGMVIGCICYFSYLIYDFLKGFIS